MPNLGNVPIKGDRIVQPCPTCGMPVRIVRRADGYADHYEFVSDMTMEDSLAPQDERTAALMREKRKGKRTVALVGMSPSSCSLAPYEDESVEIWALNEAHAFPWMQRADRWFQMHPRRYFMREVAVRDVRGHYEWLCQEHGFPIYMQFKSADIPDSVEYPLHDAQALMDKLWRGDDHINFFTATFAYMIALAISEKFERIEVYGFDMGEESLYGAQRECALFWIGMALGKGIEVLLPESTQLILSTVLYGYKGQFHRNLPEEDE